MKEQLTQETVRERALHALEERPTSLQRWVAVVIMVVTVLAAGTALLERQAATDQAHADRKARIAATQAIRAGVDWRTVLGEVDALAPGAPGYTTLAEKLSGRHDSNRTEWTLALSEAYQHATGSLQGLRNDFFGKRFVQADGRFDYEAFNVAYLAPSVEIDELRSAYARERTGWATKRGFYIADLTTFAVALFLLGLTLTVPPGTRGLFIGVGSAFALGAAAFGIWAWLQPVERVQREVKAIHAYALAAAEDNLRGSLSDPRDRDITGRVIDHATRAIEAKRDYAAAYELRADALISLDLSREGGPVGSDAAVDDLAKAIEIHRHDYFAWVNYANALFWRGEYQKALDANEHARAINDDRPYVHIAQALYELMTTDGPTPPSSYQADLAKIREVLANAPSSARTRALEGFVQGTFLALRYTLRDDPDGRAKLLRFHSDLQEISASLKTFGSPDPQPTNAALHVFAYGLDADRTHLVIALDAQQMSSTDRWFYSTYVDGIINGNFTSFPALWSAGGNVPNDRQCIKFTDVNGFKAGSVVWTEFFVNGHFSRWFEQELPTLPPPIPKGC